jgi:hypothetical protein
MVNKRDKQRAEDKKAKAKTKGKQWPPIAARGSEAEANVKPHLKPRPAFKIKLLPPATPATSANPQADLDDVAAPLLPETPRDELDSAVQSLMFLKDGFQLTGSHIDSRASELDEDDEIELTGDGGRKRKYFEGGLNSDDEDWGRADSDTGETPPGELEDEDSTSSEEGQSDEGEQHILREDSDTIN